MSLKFVTLDAFTDVPYKGNPVGVVHVPASITLSGAQKQLIAREFNLSESVILHEQTEYDKEEGDVRIDIYTPFAEVPFAGHPTVGVSNYLLRYLNTQSEWTDVKALQAKAGRIPIKLSDDGKGIRLQVAHNVHIHKDTFPDQPFSHHPVVSIVKGMTFILVELRDLDALALPSTNLIGTDKTYTSQNVLDEGWRQGIIASYFYVDLGAGSDGVRQIRSRMFGSREDPATGSAASALCSYLSLSEEGLSIRKYHLLQGVEMGRSSDINIQITLKDEGHVIEEVLLSGSAVKIMEGQLQIPSV